MFALEFMFGFAGIFMAFGVGLDPRQSKIYGWYSNGFSRDLTDKSGPGFAPVLVGITLGLTKICGGILRPEYNGPS